MRKIKILFPVILLSALVLLSGFMVLKDLVMYEKETNDLKNLDEITTIKQCETPTLPMATENTGKNNKEQDDNEKNNFQKPFYEDYQIHSIKSLISMNDDCFGWISIPGTNINYPVMHTPDNPLKYLNLNFYEEYSQSGVPFLDERCSRDSTNMIIYGHHMNNGSMFADICRYTDYSYFLEHSTIVLETEEGVSYYKVFSVMKVKSDDNWYRFITAETERKYNSKIKYAKSLSLYETELLPVYEQQLLTLSTCSGNNDTDRIIVIAAKVS